MTTTLNTLYPPQVDTFMPSFCYNESAKVWFNISSYDEDKINNIKYIHVSMVDQRNNINVFAGLDSNSAAVYPQYYPIKFSDVTYDSTKKMYWLTIPPQILKGNVPLKNGQTAAYNTKQYYKVQLRFDLTESNDGGPTKFFKIENDQVIADALGLASYTNSNEDNFSEWSTGTLLKPILIPKLKLKKFKTEEEIIDIEKETINITPSTDELIVGSLIFKDVNNDETEEKTEQLSWYQIKILESNFDSGKIYADINILNPNQINYRADFSILEANKNYTMQIIYETNNGYFEINRYPIKIVNYSSTTRFSCTPLENEDSGTIILDIAAPEENPPTNGSLIVRRSSHYSNFTKWDLIANYSVSSQFNKILVDNTIESMTGYRYQIQYMTEQNIPYEPIRTKILHCDFYGGLFSDNEKTLNISFNFQPSNRTNAVNRTKIDTLGGRYPLFTQNSKLKYHTYNISGRISTEDNGELFLPKDNLFGSEYYNYRYNPSNPSITPPHTAECKAVKPNDDWLYEREYRDAVEEWLNNGKPKLFRSMTEGNIIVMLDGISMTPDAVLGRRLYDFSATMYEIGDGKDINSLISFGLFEIIKE